MFTHYTGNRQFDLQLNRTFAPLLNRGDIARIADTALPRIRSTEDITSLAHSLAQRFDAEGDAEAVWHLHELAAFYVSPSDPSKRRTIDAMSATFDEARHGLVLTRHAIPYRDGELTAMR